MEFNSFKDYAKRATATKLGYPFEQPIDLFVFDKEAVDSSLFGLWVDSYNRFDVFRDYWENFCIINQELYAYALATAYVSSDNLYSQREEVRSCFEAATSYMLMNEEEQQLYKALPDRVTIYRGMTVKERKGRDWGTSWTLKKEVAEFYATTYMRNHATNHLPKCVYKIEVSKEQITCVFSSRQEQEVIFLK